MTHRFADLTYTDSAEAAQEYCGSRTHNDRLQTIAVTGERIITTIANEMKRFEIQYDLVRTCVVGAVADRTLLVRS